MKSNIILLNGTSSAGKTTLARALRPALPPDFCYFASDQLADAHFRPLDPAARLAGRDHFFQGFHQAIAAFAAAGNNLLVEHIIEQQSWADDLTLLLAPFHLFLVGVHAPVEEIRRRERLRGDRTVGEAMFHLKTHTFCRYQMEVDTTGALNEIVFQIVNGWRTSLSP